MSGLRLIENRTVRVNKPIGIECDWVIKQAKFKDFPSIGFSVFPSRSEGEVLNQFSDYLEGLLQSRNLFSFSYEPAEQDVFQIRNSNNSDEYLIWVFIDGIWEQELFLGGLQDFDKWSRDDSFRGKIEL